MNQFQWLNNNLKFVNMATSKRLSVMSTTPPSKEALFSYWGNQASTAQQQGWFPAVPNEKEGYTIYRAKYDAPFNDVFIPNAPNERGRIEIVGKRGNKMDIMIVDKQGNPRMKVHENVSPEFVQDYITNKNSTIQQRMNNVQSGRLAAIKGAVKKL